MTNMDCRIEKDAKGKPAKLVIEIDLTFEGVDSKTGKSVLIATSGGNKEILGMKGTKLGLNFYRLKDPSKSTAFQSKK